MPKKNVENRLV